MIYKRKDSNYWWLKLVFEGKRHQLSTKLTNKRKAEQFEDAYRTNLANGKVDLKQKKAMPSLDEAADDFLAWSKMHQGDSTYRRYVTSSKAVIKFFGNLKVDKLDRDGVEKFVKWRINQKKKAPVRKLKKNKNAQTKKSIAPATVNRELAFLKIVLNRLIEKDTISKNPVARYKFLPENKDTFQLLARRDDLVYLMACSQPLQDVATIMLDTGMRPAEVYSLKKTDINFDQNYLQVTTGKTKSARRKLRMSTRMVDLLRRRVTNSPTEYVFAGGKDGASEKPIVKLNNAHNATFDGTKLKRFRLYDLRHTFATRAVEDGMDLMTLKNILGHSRLDMVLKYAHPSEEHQLDEMRKLEERREGLKLAAAS